MPLAGDEDDQCLINKNTRNITGRNYNLYSIYVQYNTRKKGYCFPLVVERIKFNVKFLIDRSSSQGQKVMERLRNTHGNENPGRKNPKIRVENKHEAKQIEKDNDFDDMQNSCTMEYNHYNDMRNVGGYYGRVLHSEMM